MSQSFWSFAVRVFCVGMMLVSAARGESPASDVAARAGVGPMMTWDPAAAAQVLGRVRQENDPALADAVATLRRKADEALGGGPFSVTEKTFLPPSGDRHDFSTLGRYYWPNPDTPDGLPWIRRDGQTNPQYFDPAFGDTQRFLDLWHHVQVLSRAYYFTGDEPYAAKTAQLLRAWFIDPPTRMNPNARYAARFPGNWEGKCYGIHGTRQLTWIVDAAVMLEASPAWTAADRQAMRDWVGEYLDWLLSSEHGLEEAATINNHAVAYDWLVARLAMYVDRAEVANQVLGDFYTKRIVPQIEPDGSMPAELNRAKAWNYEGYALEYLFAVAILADQVGVDLWREEAVEGRGLRAALDYIVRHIEPEPGRLDEQILADVTVKRIGPLLAIAAKVYAEPRYEQLMQRIGWENRVDLNVGGPNVLFVGAP